MARRGPRDDHRKRAARVIQISPKTRPVDISRLLQIEFIAIDHVADISAAFVVKDRRAGLMRRDGLRDRVRRFAAEEACQFLLPPRMFGPSDSGIARLLGRFLECAAQGVDRGQERPARSGRATQRVVGAGAIGRSFLLTVVVEVHGNEMATARSR